MNVSELKNNLAAAIADLTASDAADILLWLETPPNAELGDLAFPCFRLAKQLRKGPPQIAADLAAKLAGKFPEIARLEVMGGYVNVHFAKAWFAESVLTAVLAAGETPGIDLAAGAGRTVIVEFSSPNIAKDFHVGHAFTTLLGQAIANLMDYRGYKVIRMNHLGDYGTQFGNLIVAWKAWGDEQALELDPIKELQRVYVKFHHESEADETLADQGRAAFQKLENGDPENVELWQKFRQLSLDVFNETYKRLGIVFDNTNGESFYSDKIPHLLNWLAAKGLLEQSEGATVVNLDEFNLPPCLLIKSDGSTIYASRDLAAILWRDETYDFSKNIYVVGLPQSHHFKQVFAVMKKAGFAKAADLIHVGFGTVFFGDAKFSSRGGNTISMKQLLDESVAKTKAIMLANNPTMDPLLASETAEKIGISAVAFTFVRNGREKDIQFSWDEMLDFEGDSAPYLLYTLARCRSIRARAVREGNASDGVLSSEMAAYLTDAQAIEVLTLLDGFKASIDAAIAQYEPSIMLRHVMMLARAFNRFYQHHSILFDENELAVAARLALLDGVINTLTAGIRLAGMKPVERM